MFKMFIVLSKKENETFHTRLSLTAGNELEIPALQYASRIHPALWYLPILYIFFPPSMLMECFGLYN